MPDLLAAAKHNLRSALGSWGRRTAGLRGLPDFLIIGAQRCGTTSLYKYLTGHPGVVAPPLGKGAHFFDINFHRGERWYRGHFPTRAARRGRITGEGSPYYLFHPAVPQRVAEVLPDVKLVVMLRDPVERAWSQYWHEVARGYETVPFEDALDLEEERLAGEEERLLAEPSYHSIDHQHHSYVARGRYAEQLERWLARFPREQLLVVPSDRFFADPESAYHAVLRFLGLPPRSLTMYAAHNPRRYGPIPEPTRARLEDAFAAPNARLEELLGTRFGWTPTRTDG